jgi:hypothetical protein
MRRDRSGNYIAHSHRTSVDSMGVGPLWAGGGAGAGGGPCACECACECGVVPGSWPPPAAHGAEAFAAPQPAGACAASGSGAAWASGLIDTPGIRPSDASAMKAA